MGMKMGTWPRTGFALVVGVSCLVVLVGIEVCVVGMECCVGGDGVLCFSLDFSPAFVASAKLGSDVYAEMDGLLLTRQ